MLPLLLLALRNKDARYLTVIAALGLALFISRATVKEQAAALAAKPKTVERIVTVTKVTQGPVRIVQGPVRIVEKIIEKPGGERIVERTIEREAKTTDKAETITEVAKAEDRKSEPAQIRAPRWLAGITYRERNDISLRAGITIGGKLDLTLGHTIVGPARHEAGIGVRF